MEHGPFMDDLPIEHIIFHNHLKLPEIPLKLKPWFSIGAHTHIYIHIGWSSCSHWNPMGPMTMGPMTKGGHQARPYRCFRGCLGCRPLVVPGHLGGGRRLFDQLVNGWWICKYAIIFCYERRVVTHTPKLNICHELMKGGGTLQQSLTDDWCFTLKDIDVSNCC